MLNDIFVPKLVYSYRYQNCNIKTLVSHS